MTTSRVATRVNFTTSKRGVELVTRHGTAAVVFAVAAVLLLAVVTSNARASDEGPFGLRMGMSREEVLRHGTTLRSKGNNRLVVSSVPKPHPKGEFYSVLFGTTGLCAVAMTTTTYGNDAHGTDIRRDFDQLKDALDLKYGHDHSDYDFLDVGSIWKEPNDWMMSLAKKERTLASFWLQKPGVPAKPGAVVTIALTAVGLSQTTGHINVHYEFENFKQCKAESNAADDSVL